MSKRFIHLRVHTEFSLVDGINRLSELIDTALNDHMPALAVTDQSFMCAQIRFYQLAQKAGIKAICGCDLWLENENASPFRFTLLCMNEQGYRNLMHIVTLSFQKGQKNGKACCKREWVLKYADGLIMLSGGRNGDIGAALLSGQCDEAERLIHIWNTAFPERFYLELQRTQRDNEEHYITLVVNLAARLHCPVVATNEVVFMVKSDFEAHEARVCIGEGTLLEDPHRAKNYSEEQYFKLEHEMMDLFKDIPSAIENTIEIAKRCNVHISLHKHHLPKYPTPSGLTVEDFFRKSAAEGLKQRLSMSPPTQQKLEHSAEQYLERLNFEINIILQMGFAGYFLIVMDFIQQAKKFNIPVGPGRGSGAGSLVAYALHITDLDPMIYNLLFERFLNPERVSMPDFDIDFCVEHRDEVIDYVARTYGRDAVAQIITFGTMSAKAVVRDVARVQGKPYALADKLSKLIPSELGMTLTKALNQEENLQEFLQKNNEAQEIWDLALKLEGITRNVGKHAGGVVIAPNKLIDFSPLYCDEEGLGLVTQYDKNDVETAGLVKFDFLGLRTLTIIDGALKMINERQSKNNAPLININHIPLDDAQSYTFLQSGKTTAVFQLESRGMQDLIKRLLPDCFEDIIALVALFRPGPLQSGMVNNFIDRKHGREKISYPDAQYQHASLKIILEPTYGIILYQEQVMQIARIMAGYTLGEADLLRRAMGKKKPEEMAKQRAIFKTGAMNKEIDPILAMKIFDLVEKFAGYGFNKSHSAAYALISYQTLWLKVHYPAEFMAAVMSSDMQNTDKIVIFFEESRRLKLTVSPPHINDGQYIFSVNKQGEIIYGLGAIKGVGAGPIKLITDERKNGPFRHLFDFCQRIEMKKINKRCMDALIRSGALDEIGPNETLNKKRAMLLSSLAHTIKAANQIARNSQAGLGDLFRDCFTQETTSYSSEIEVTPWTDNIRLLGEKDTLGFYLTGHLIDEYHEELRYLTQSDISQLQPTGKANIAGIITALRITRNKRGEKIAFLTLDDNSSRIDVAIFSKVFSKVQHKLIKDSLLIIEGEINHDDYSGSLKVTAHEILDLVEARTLYAKAIGLRIHADQYQKTKCNLLQCFKEHNGTFPVIIYYSNAKASVRLVMDQQYCLKVEQPCIDILRTLFGKENVKILYAGPQRHQQ